jgi:acyl carrier protein
VHTVVDIEQEVLAILADLTQDWELDLDGGITAATRLMHDLAFESIDVVQLAVAIEQRFERKGLPFESLFIRDGDYVDDLTVGEVVVFLRQHL